MERHLFKRTETKNGRKETRWYYWFYDENGKQVKKSCGQHGKPCYLKKEAEAFLAHLEEQDRENQRERQEAQQVRLKDVGANLYDDDSFFMKLKMARGKALHSQTIAQKKRILKSIMSEFGERIPKTIEEGEIENYIISLDYKNSYKNTILGVFRDLFSECKRLKVVEHKLDIECFSRVNTEKKDILTLEQLKILFPSDKNKLAEVWSVTKNDKYIGIDGLVHSYGFMYGVMFRLMASTGLRPGEVRAVCIDQIQEGGLFVNRMLDVYDNLCAYLKKGNDENKKQRTVLLPSEMAKLLEEYIAIRPKCEQGFIFSFNGLFVSENRLAKRFKYGITKAGICSSGKRLSPHSLRFTYNTYTVNSNLIPAEVLRKMIGHNSQIMTDYYTRPDLEAQLQGLQPYQKNVDEIWNKVK